MSLLLSACSGMGDWTYDELPGDYDVLRSSSKNNSLCQPSEDGGLTPQIIVGTYVDQLHSTNGI